MTKGYFNSLSIVLRSADYRDFDRMLTLFTKEHGKVSVNARGVRKQGAQLLHACELFSCADFTFYRSKNGNMSITQAQLKNSFFDLRSDVLALTVASVLADICEKTVMEDEPNSRLFALMASALYYLNEGEDPIGILVFFIYKSLDILGLRPETDTCVVCGAAAANKVDITRGGVVCEKCRGEEVKPEYLVAIRNIFGVASKNMNKHLPSVDEAFLDLSVRWLCSSLDIRPKGLSVLNSLIRF